MRKMLKFAAAAGLTVTLLAVSGCDLFTKKTEPVQETPQPTAAETLEPTAQPTPTPIPQPVTSRVKLAAIGDVLIHNTVYQDAADGQGGYNFKPMLEPVRDMLLSSDLLIANSESIIGGKELGLSSYPMFNSPHEVGDALLDAGVDLVTMANNHTLDKGEKGVLSATAYWDKLGIPYTGAFRSPEDQEKLRTLSINGIEFAILSYTYGTNGIPVPAGKPYLVQLMDGGLMRTQITQAKQASDAVIVAMHWGVENQEKPNDEQRQWASMLAEWGADVIIGTHPHVLQPFEWIHREDGGKTLVMYSLGNFLSAQSKLPQLIGGIGQVEVVKVVTGDQSELTLENPSIIPTYNKYKNWRNYRVIPFSSLEHGDKDTVAPVWNRIRAKMEQAMPELQILE